MAAFTAVGRHRDASLSPHESMTVSVDAFNAEHLNSVWRLNCSSCCFIVIFLLRKKTPKQLHGPSLSTFSIGRFLMPFCLVFSHVF